MIFVWEPSSKTINITQNTDTRTTKNKMNSEINQKRIRHKIENMKCSTWNKMKNGNHDIHEVETNGKKSTADI